MDMIEVGDMVTVHKPVLDDNGDSDGLYWNPDMDCYDGKTGIVSDVDENGFSFRIDGFDSFDEDFYFWSSWSFRPSWVVKVTDEIMVSSMSVDELFE